ncbi:hypothetical protein B0H17DRAFT_415466 [Mycena rosella]|uniref:Uncharacterized protein n=1 Tax=Mycena rosella TaxID=1033263 RepID=A0AAD7GI83_MYCRO|nr:hypothetical protein B0H17DRAFT_415466 [Mycena rosella]
MDQQWLCQFDIVEAFQRLKLDKPTSSHMLLDGPAQSSRFELPLEKFYCHRVTFTGGRLKIAFLQSILHQAHSLKPGDQLVILLFGHGGFDRESKVGKMECGESTNGQRCWVTRADVEDIFQKESCRGRVSVISNSCFAEYWASKHWDLFAAGRAEESTGPTPSDSDRSWGSPLCSSSVELAANTHGFTFHPDLKTPGLANHFSPPLPHSLQPLEAGEEPPRFSIESHDQHIAAANLPNVVEAVSYTTHNSTPDDVPMIHSFLPTIPDNTQTGWPAILGSKDDTNIHLEATVASPRGDKSFRL